MLSNKQEYDAILTDLDLTQISATPKTITPTQIWGGGGTNYNEMENNFQALKTTGILCSPIAEVDITAMGYVDGKLHIQVKYEDSLETDNHGYIYFKMTKERKSTVSQILHFLLIVNIKNGMWNMFMICQMLI